MVDARIAQLRGWMAQHQVDAYLVPHADRFQSEYLQPSEERLAWLTGFTGSIGLAAILPEHAVFFTSGIYTLQASLQINTKIYDIVESPPTSPSIWMHHHLHEGNVIGFDPLMFTVTQIAQWKKSLADKHVTFLPIEENPIDLFWTDKKEEVIIPAEAHDIAYAGETTEKKIAKILQRKQGEAHHILISDPSLVCWLLNMRGGDIVHTPLVQSLALLDSEGQVTLFTDPRKITPALHASWGNHVGVEDIAHLQDVILKIGRPIQIDPTQAPYAIKHFCEKFDIAVIEANDPALMLRACKNVSEIKGAFAAHETDAKAFDLFFEWFHKRDFSNETITELDIVAKLHDCRLATGQCIDESFNTIAGFGPNGAIIHYIATQESNLQLKPGSLLLLDSGGQYRNGTTDITRVFAIGTPTQQMKTHYTAVLKGLIALSTTRFPVGTTGTQIDGIARVPIWNIGYDYAHGTGHGVGSYLSVHEGPMRINQANYVPLQAGMIMSIEPGIYLQGKYGIRLENLVVIVEDKRPDDIKDMLAFKTLTRVKFEKELIDFDTITEKEMLFLKDFL